jgi:hypothetical protein
LQDGVIYIGAAAGVKIATSLSRLEQPTSTLGLFVPSFGSVRDGQTFSVSDGLTNIVFEFDSNGAIGPGRTRIDTTSASSVADLARIIRDSIDASPLSLTPRLIGTDTVHLGLSASGSVARLTSSLDIVGVSRSVADGQSFTITFGSVSKTFEFTTDGIVGAGIIPIPIQLTDTQDSLGERTALAIRDAGLSLTPDHIRDGNISIGGTSQHTISVLNAPSISLFGQPDVAPKTTVEITGTLVMQVPTRGGLDMRDNTTFALTVNNRTVVFEFDQNFSGPSSPANVVIPFSVASSANEIVDRIATAINGTTLGVNARPIGNGRVDLGILANSAVNVVDSGLTTRRGNVVDAEFFTINFGTTTAVFEFVNVSLGGGAAAGRIPILYDNSSTQADVITSMKAAIEGARLSLSTTVLGPSSLRMEDTPRYTYDFSTAPSLLRTGVPGGAYAIPFVQDGSFTAKQVAESMVRAINAASNTPLEAKIRAENTLFVENALSISPDIPNFFLRAVEDLVGNDLKPNRINDETQFTILMPGIEMDYGDAPDPVTTTPGRYPTSLVYDGARHVSSASPLRLGATVTGDVDGNPSPTADADAGDDGITFQFQNIAAPVFNKFVDTTVTVTLSTPGIVYGWIDFNADGDWTDPGEDILNGVEFTEPMLTRSFDIRIPATAPAPTTGTNTFARFRVSSAGNLLPTGLALDGEVEDYVVRLVPGTPATGTTDNYALNEDQVGGYVTTDPTGRVTPGFTVDDGVLANDVSPDGLSLLARILVPPQNFDLFQFRSNGTFEYQPKPDFFGTDTFVYLSYTNVDLAQGIILESLTPTTVTITVRPVNDVPTGTGFTLTTDEDTSISRSELQVLTLAGAVAGPSNESNQTLRVSLPNNVSARGGSVSIANGTLTYLPLTDFSGTDTFSITITDNGITGNLSDPQSITRVVTVIVSDKNDPPIVTPKSFSIQEDGIDTRPIAFYIDGDTAGPPIEVNAPNNQTITFDSVEPRSEAGGTVSIVNGQIEYRPSADFNGTDRIYYTVRDNGISAGQPDPRTSRGTVTVTVDAVDDAPRVVAPFGTITMVEDASERALPLANHFFDPDVVPNGDILNYRIVSNSNSNLVEPSFGPTDLFIRPKADQNGSAIVVIEATDSRGNSARNTLTLNVTAVNDEPRIGQPLPNLSVNEDATIANITLSPTHFFDPDSINGDVLTFAVTNTNPDLVAASIVNGQLVVSLAADGSGQATITVRATDRDGNFIEDSFDINVAPVNDAPRVSNDPFYLTPQGVELRTTDARGSLTTIQNDDGVLANDRDVEGNTFTARVTIQPQRGTVSMNADGTFSYIPGPSAIQGGSDTFTYVATDSLGAVSTPATVTIQFTAPPPSSHQNQTNNVDVNADGFVSPLDVLLIVNFINFRPSGAGDSIDGLAPPPPYRDANGDRRINALDALVVINFINTRGNAGGEGEGTELVGLDGSAPMVWSTDVLRTPINVGIEMSEVVDGSSMLRPANAARPLGEYPEFSEPMSLADYLASFGNETEEAAEDLALLTASSEQEGEHSSLDQFFAEVFG